MPSIEHEILAHCCNVAPDQDQLLKIRSCMSNAVDAERLIDLAVKEGLAGFLYKNFFKAGLLETLNPKHKQRLYTIYYLTVRYNLKLIHGLNTILEPLNQKGVPVVLIQGIALLQQVYRDIGLRPMQGMNLWVRPNDYQCLVNTLISQGFERDSLYLNTFKKGEAVLDIHSHILRADRIKSGDYLLNKSQTGIFNNTVSVDLDGRKALCLGPQDQFLYLGLHALKHNLDRLVWLADIKSLIADWNQADWKTLMNQAEVLGQKTTLFYILFLLKGIFKFELPPEISSYLNSWKPNFLEKRVLHRRINGRSIPIWGQPILFLQGVGFHKRFSFFVKILFSRPEVLQHIFSNSPQLSVGQLYWKRVLQMIGVSKVS